MNRKTLSVLAVLVALQLLSSCGRTRNPSTDTSQESTPAQEAASTPAVFEEPVAAEESPVPSVIQLVPVVAGVEHLLHPFELFAPNEAVGEPRIGSQQLSEELDPCDRNAPGQPIRQQPLLYGPNHPPDMIRSEFFEGVGGPGIHPSCFSYGDGDGHGYAFSYFSQLTDRSPERLVTWNEVPGLMKFEAVSSFEGESLRLEVRAESAVKTGQTYWLDHCVGQDSVIFNERSRYYYFNPEPLEIDFQDGKLEQQRTEDSASKRAHQRGPVQVDMVLNTQVDSWWQDLPVQGRVEPYLLVHQPKGRLNVLLYWQDAAMLKVNWKRCIHVNPAVVANGESQTLRGELYVFRAEVADALVFARALIAR